jgi:hypothetical protein
VYGRHDAPLTANAPQRAGAAPRKEATSAPSVKRYPFEGQPRTPAANDATRDAHANRFTIRRRRRLDAPRIGERAAARGRIEIIANTRFRPERP